MPSDILIHTAIWPQQKCAENSGLCPFGEGELGPHQTQCGQGRGVPACQISSWSGQTFGHNARTLQTDRKDRQRTETVLQMVAQKSSAVAEMGDRGHNRHGPKRGGLLCSFRGELGPRL